MNFYYYVIRWIINFNKIINLWLNLTKIIYLLYKKNTKVSKIFTLVLLPNNIYEKLLDLSALKILHNNKKDKRRIIFIKKYQNEIIINFNKFNLEKKIKNFNLII